MKDLIEHFLNPQDTIKFAKWAFGDDFENLIAIEFMINWNRLHGEIYKLDPTCSIRKDILKMIELWEKESSKV